MLKQMKRTQLLFDLHNELHVFQSYVKSLARLIGNVEVKTVKMLKLKPINF